MLKLGSDKADDLVAAARTAAQRTRRGRSRRRPAPKTER
jgi:hypothetical protein